MNNIITYLQWRGDILFKERTFNEVDSLICALLGYIEWDGIVNDQAIYLNEACKKYLQEHSLKDMNLTYSYSPMLVELVTLLQNIPRFNEVKLKKYVSIFDSKAEAQFAAVSIEIPTNILYIAYRGTDTSILGWKEDFGMTYQDVISSQEMALQYLLHAQYDVVEEKKILGLKYSSKAASLYLGGHSKGGNLAMYAAICGTAMQSYITAVHSFDGPGFRPQFYELKNREIINKIYNYVPVSSIIGRMMEHQETFCIVDAYSSGIQQHDAFYWRIMKDAFCMKKSWTKESDKVKKYLDDVLISKSDEEKKQFISAVYKILADLNINNINDFNEISIKNSILGIKELNALGKEESKMFYEMLKLVLSQSKSFIYQKTLANKKSSLEL